MTKSLAVVLVVSLPCLAQSLPPPPLIDARPPQGHEPAAAPPSPHRAADALEGPLTALPLRPGLDPAVMDRSAGPCTDFHRYACGGWLAANPIPAGHRSWSVYARLEDENARLLWGILEEAARPGVQKTIHQRKLGDYYASCMNQTSLEGLSWIPLRPLLAQIDAIASTRELAAFLGREHLRSPGGGWLFGFGAEPDPEADSVVPTARAGGLSLPDRDHYVRDDAFARDVRERFVAHVTRMLQMIRLPRARAQQDARSVLRLETALARASAGGADRDGLQNFRHEMTVADLQTLTPRFDWIRYLRESKVSTAGRVAVPEPAFFREVDRQLALTPLAQWKAYLRWKAVHSRAPYLADRFVTEHFSFFRRTLQGADTPPRWKQCVEYAGRDLGDALGQEFVRRTFSPAARDHVLAMTRAVERAMEQEIRSLEWMSDAARKKALEKLQAVTYRIGYPDRPKDYLALRINRTDFYGNVVRSAVFESERRLRRIGRPVDQGEWSLPAHSVEARYEPRTNSLTIPAGVLQPPLYDPKLDDAVNYGSTGSMIGHHLIHAFDAGGPGFGARAGLTNWWTDEDARRLDARLDCIVEQRDSERTAAGGTAGDPRASAAEDAAAIGGTRLAGLAWKALKAKSRLEPRDGLTPEQRFFVAFAQRACEATLPPNSDPATAPEGHHPPGPAGVNTTFSHLPQFRDAFVCKAGDPMVRARPCKVW